MFNPAREVGHITRSEGLQGVQSSTTNHRQYVTVEFANGNQYAVGKVPARLRDRAILATKKWVRLS
jgi:hypothetical protein